MGQVQKTAIEAYERDLADAEKAAVEAAANVEKARAALHARRVEEGLEAPDTAEADEASPETGKDGKK